jgi:drug/metabolite transporter (DMT)-like permease
VSGASPEQAQRLRLLGVVVLMSFLFGNNFVALDIALRDSGPITLQAIAVTVAAVTVWLLTFREKLPIREMSRDTRWAIAAISMALSVASPVLMVYGVQRVNPAVAAMLVTTAPISTLLLERIVFKHRLTPIRVFGVGLGFIGVGFVVVPLGGEGASEIIGIAVLIGASFAWAVGLILTRRLRGVVGGGRFVIWQMVAALPVLYTMAIVIEGLRIDWSWSYVAAVGYSGAFAKGIASFLQFRTVRVGSPLQSSLAAFMVPAVATVSTYVILGETVMAIQLVGMALIAAAVGIVIGAHRQDSAALYDTRPPRAD